MDFEKNGQDRAWYNRMVLSTLKLAKDIILSLAVRSIGLHSQDKKEILWICNEISNHISI